MQEQRTKIIKYASLFTGIGVFDKAASDLGMQIVFQSENDSFCTNTLKKNFPGIPNLGDVRNAKTDQYYGTIDIISGGFPCQDISVAGLGEGIHGKRSGLWSEYFRIITEVSPQFIIVENSPMLLRRGFEKILYDLSTIGYDAEWECFSAAEYGHKHVRERLFVVAYPTTQRWRGILHFNKGSLAQKDHKANALDSRCNTFLRFEERFGEPAVFGVYDGLAKELDAINRLGACGNAVVYNIAYDILNLIKTLIKP